MAEGLRSKKSESVFMSRTKSRNNQLQGKLTCSARAGFRGGIAGWLHGVCGGPYGPALYGGPPALGPPGASVYVTIVPTAGGPEWPCPVGS